MKPSDMRWGSMRLVASIIMFCSLQLMQTWAAIAALVPEEENALEVLRDSFKLDNWTGDPCVSVDWITCSNTNTTANAEIILLKNKNLTGTIPDEISELRHLRELYLDHNQLTGPIPDLRNMTSLTQLDLSENDLIGPLPDTTTLTNLSQVTLSGNKFTGGIPPSIFNHSTLKKLRFDDSPLGGTIPDLSGLNSVTELYISNNSLTGRIPDSVTKLPQAMNIYFRYMRGISGPLPDLNLMSNVWYWDSSECSLSGPLPEFINSTELKGLQLYDNNFTGSIPQALFRHEQLQWLDLYKNPGLTGEVPDVSQLLSVEVFSIYDCNLTGPLPSFANNSKLRFLNLWNNRLTEFASDLRNLTQLAVIDLQNNSIRGSLPELPSGSSQIRVEKDYILQNVRLSNNSFSGEIPKSWHELTYLEELRIDRNNLSGFLPKEIGNLTNLKNVDLSNNFFSGPIPEEIGLLQHLETLDLRNNQFNGTVPESLASAPNLTKVWLDNNSFTGIPQALINKLGMNISFANNTNIEIISGKSTTSSGLSTGGIIGIVIGAVGAAIAVLAILLYVHKKRSGKGLSKEDMPKSAKAYSLKDINLITGNYKTLIGKGGFGPVYYGRLSDGKEVAVKVRAADSKQGAGEFLNEVRLLSRLHHRNLVSLVGYCLESRQQILVYDYMSQGNLHSHLHHTASEPISAESTSDHSLTHEMQPLSWKVRVEIAINAGRGLEYLHKDCNPPVIHRDVKASNILLGDKLQAKVTDLGISKQVPEFDNEDVEAVTASGVSTAVKGTFGYLDPEYFVRRKLTTKSDVYSFGIVLLEIITGKRPHGLDFPESAETNLIDWVRSAVERNEVDSIVDPTLKGGYNEEGMLKVARGALSCVSPSGGERPDMGEIVNVLTEALQIEGGNIDMNSDLKNVDEKAVRIPFSSQISSSPDELNMEPQSNVSYPFQTTKSNDG